jgi:hypothetical protein
VGKGESKQWNRIWYTEKDMVAPGYENAKGGLTPLRSERGGLARGQRDRGYWMELM